MFKFNLGDVVFTYDLVTDAVKRGVICERSKVEHQCPMTKRVTTYQTYAIRYARGVAAGYAEYQLTTDPNKHWSNNALPMAN